MHSRWNFSTQQPTICSNWSRKVPCTCWELHVMGRGHILLVECFIQCCFVLFVVITQWSIKRVESAHMGAHQGAPWGA